MEGRGGFRIPRRRARAFALSPRAELHPKPILERRVRARYVASMSAENRPAPRDVVLVSACLVGSFCRHDGRTKKDLVLLRELARDGVEIVPFCPEEEGGLGTPRPEAWIEREGAHAVLDGRDRVVAITGADVTREFVRGAELALAQCQRHGIRRAFLKERSPSCGVCQTYVGGELVDTPGVTGELLKRNGIAVEGIEGLRE